MDVVATLLFFVALIAIVLGLIKPGLVIWRGQRKTRPMVLLTYGALLVLSFIWIGFTAPSAFDAGKEALAQSKYEDAAKRLSRVKESDANFAEAQSLLVQAREGLYRTRLEQAKTASSMGNHEKVTSLLSDFPPNAAGSEEASQLRESSRAALANVASEREEQRSQEIARAAADKAQREERERAEAAQRKEDRQMVDYPKCDSRSAMEEVAATMDNAPLGRVFGLSIIKISNAQQVSGSASERACTGTAQLNNAQSYPISFRFYRDGEDIMIEAEVHGLDE